MHQSRMPSGKANALTSAAGLPAYLVRRGLVVSEPSRQYRTTPEYESEGSERRSLGSVDVASDARWTGMLTVPIVNADVAFFQLERRGETPPNYRGAEETAAFSLPIAEADAVVALLSGLVAQARTDGVLPQA
jgi:hypothetical protein